MYRSSPFRIVPALPRKHASMTRMLRTPTRRSLLALACALVAGGIQAGEPPRYRIEYLPTLSGSSTATSINDLGIVAGRSTRPSTPTEPPLRRAVRWRNGQIEELGTLGGPQSSVPWPVENLRGIISGIAETGEIDSENEDWSCVRAGFFLRIADQPRYKCRGFVWENGKMKMLPTFGGNHGFATGTNNFGKVVGWAETTVRDPERCELPQKFQFRAALWDARSGRITELPPLVSKGDSVSAATAINDRGQVVGISGRCDQAVGRFSAIHAVMWEHGRIHDLGTLGGESWNTPMAINVQGDVVGFGNKEVRDDGALVSGAFLWTRQAGIRALPELAGDLGSQANGLNIWRHAVGRSCATPDLGDCDAVLWRNGKVHKLSELIPDFPSDGTRLINASDIDSFGRISGQALVEGVGVAYVATPIR